jgi:hypothetical protein
MRPEFDMEALLDKARDTLRSFDGPIDAVVGYWDFPSIVMLPTARSKVSGKHNVDNRQAVTSATSGRTEANAPHIKAKHPALRSVRHGSTILLNFTRTVATDTK